MCRSLVFLQGKTIIVKILHGFLRGRRINFFYSSRRKLLFFLRYERLSRPLLKLENGFDLWFLQHLTSFQQQLQRWELFQLRRICWMRPLSTMRNIRRVILFWVVDSEFQRDELLVVFKEDKLTVTEVKQLQRASYHDRKRISFMLYVLKFDSWVPHDLSFRTK